MMMPLYVGGTHMSLSRKDRDFLWTVFGIVAGIIIAVTLYITTGFYS